VSRRQVRGALRPAGRLLQHRRERGGRNHLQRLPAGEHGGPRHRGRRAAARLQAGGGRVRDVRLEHHAGVHHRPGGARLHSGSHHRRVPPLPPPNRDPAGGHLLQREREQLRPLEQGDPDGGAGAQGRAPRPPEAQELALRGLPGRRLPPEPHRRRHLPLPGGHQEPPGQAAAALRGEPHGLPGRAGRGLGDRRGEPDPGHRAPEPPPAHPAGDRFAGGRGLRRRHAPGGRRAAERSHPDAGAVKVVYGPGDWAGDPARDLGQPGSFPFTRGIYPGMYTRRLWTMRQYAGFGTAEETNERFRRLLAAGQMGLSVAFDLPTQMGYDSDHPNAAGEVGRVGVAVDTVDDLAVLFRGIPLDRVSTSMTINATAAILLAMYVVVGEEQGVPRAKLTGTVQNDVLKEYIARGTYIYPARPSLRLVADIFRFVTDHRMS